MTADAEDREARRIAHKIRVMDEGYATLDNAQDKIARYVRRRLSAALEAKAQAEAKAAEIGEYRTSWQQSSMDAQRELYLVKVERDSLRALVRTLVEALQGMLVELDQHGIGCAVHASMCNCSRRIAEAALRQAQDGDR